MVLVLPLLVGLVGLGLRLFDYLFFEFCHKLIFGFLSFYYYYYYYFFFFSFSILFISSSLLCPFDQPITSKRGKKLPFFRTSFSFCFVFHTTRKENHNIGFGRKKGRESSMAEENMGDHLLGEEKMQELRARFEESTKQV